MANVLAVGSSEDGQGMDGPTTANALHADVMASDMLANSNDSLAQLSSRLTQFLSGSETVFLHTGNHLQDLAQKATNIVSSSGDATTLGGAGASANPVRSLSQALALMEQHLSSSREVATMATTSLANVLEHIDRLVSTGSEFSRIATTLHALATSLRVEDGRKATGFGFASVAQDVLRLGRSIATKFDAILARSETLRAVTQSACRGEREFLEKQGSRAATLLTEARTSLSVLSDLDRASSAIHKQASASSSNIGRRVTSVLMSLQTHDITRQILEHVVEAMQSFTKEEVETDERLTPDKATIKDTEEALADSSQEHYADLSCLCHTQSRQIGKARQSLVSAQSSIAQTLRQLSAEVDSIVSGTRHLTDDEGRGGSLVCAVERSVNQAAQSLHQQLKHEEQTLATVASVVQTAADMEGFVAQIATIAKDVRVVALNALVKAVKTGSDGAVFAVLARTIKDLSVEVADKTTLVGQSMREMMHVARGLGQTTQQRISDGNMEENLARLMADLRRYHQGLQSSLTTLRDGSTSIATEVDQLVRGLARQAQATDQLQVTENELEDMAVEARALAGEVMQSRQSRWAEAASKRYTMEVERIVHDSTTHSSGNSAPTSSTPSELGDNVELF